MKLTKLTIRNYKGIKKISLNIENISLVIGPNNCSKSTVLQALVQFSSSDKKLKKELYHKHLTSEPISFHATFDNLTPEEIEMHGIKKSLHEPTGKFIVRSIYKFGCDVERASKLGGNEDHDMEDENWDGKMGGGKGGSHFLNVFPEIIYIPAVKNASDYKCQHKYVHFRLHKDVQNYSFSLAK